MSPLILLIFAIIVSACDGNSDPTVASLAQIAPAPSATPSPIPCNASYLPNIAMVGNDEEIFLSQFTALDEVQTINYEDPGAVLCTIQAMLTPVPVGYNLIVAPSARSSCAYNFVGTFTITQLAGTYEIGGSIYQPRCGG